MSRRSDRSEGQLLLGPRHGAEDGAGRRAYEAYADLDPVGAPPPPRRFIDYPRRSRRGWTRWIPSWRLVLSLFLLMTASLCAVVLVSYSRTELPSQQNVDATFQATIVYDASGKKEIGRFAAQNRIWVPLRDIPVKVQDAFLAAEDRTFRDNSGVSFTAVMRAAVNNVRGGARQGGSTITQQYVKNAYSDPNDRSVGRKLNEFFVSIKAAQTLSKDEILERYLNIIYYGRGCYGIEAASQCYFGKSVKNLTPSEAAYLAGILTGPEYFDSGKPAARAAANARRIYVLDGMVTEGWLTPAERAKAAVPPKVRPRTQAKTARADDQTQYLMAMVQQEAQQKYRISEQDLQRGGYVITTTFDPAKVKAATASVNEILGPRRTWPAGTQAALVTVDARNGQVVSLYAGDGKRSQNAVTQDIVQAGSTFKPFGLVAALEGKRERGNCDPQAADDDSVNLRSRFDGRSPQRFPGLQKPVTNFGGESFGKIDLVKATANSVNTVYAELNRKVGPEHTMQVALCAGYPEGTTDLDATALNVLGPSSPHPIDVARAFSTFAAQGVHHDTFVIKGIRKTDGEVVVTENKGEGRRVFDKDVMADATYAMQSVVKQGSATAVRSLGRPVAGKTGTSSLNKSAWFAGFTPRYATVVALYRIGKDGSQQPLVPWGGIGNEVVGGGYPAQVWTYYMSQILEGTPVEEFPKPPYGGETVDPSPSPMPSPSSSAPVPTPSVSESEPEESPSPSLPSPSASSPSPSPPTPSPTDPEPSPPPTPSPPGIPKPSPTA